MNGVNFAMRGIDFRLSEHDDTKQDVLVPGVNIKNINGIPMTGPGNVVIADWPIYNEDDLAIEYPVLTSGMRYDSSEMAIIIN